MFFKDGMMIFGGAFDKGNAREAFEAQKEKLVSMGAVESGAFDAPQRTEACLVCRPRFNKGIFVGEGRVFFVGEAAGFISPSSFEGISYALLSAEALADSFNRRRKADAVLRSYKRRSLRLVWKVWIKCLKRPFMYNQILRRLVMKSGLTAIKLKKENGNEL
jgi:2-polyprenyl-6-methoxyphenol hydroxylase-like FAD-dependent oxidoreductase